MSTNDVAPSAPLELWNDGTLWAEQPGAGAGPRFALLVHHDDAAREFVHDRESDVGRLARGLDETPARGWTVVSMKHDWKRVFALQGP
jgi:hypothetical protein